MEDSNQNDSAKWNQWSSLDGKRWKREMKRIIRFISPGYKTPQKGVIGKAARERGLITQKKNRPND